MTEQEWLESTDPGSMYQYLEEHASDRKLRLFACACVRKHWDQLSHELYRLAIEVAERFADGQAKERELRKVNRAAAALLAHSVPRIDLCAIEASNDANGPGVASILAQSTAEGIVEAIWQRSHRMQDCDKGQKNQTEILRCIFGNPFRPSTFSPACLTPDVLALAQAAYEERLLPSGELDIQRLAVLADALEEAGCADADVLHHCRGQERCPVCLGEGKKNVTVISAPRRTRESVIEEEIPCFACGRQGYRAPGAGHVRGCWVLDLILAKS
jgi:hypothetical protein